MSSLPTPPSGLLLIDKPVDWTSFDIVAKLRRITGIRKIGHAGTLDPFATGLLLVAVSRNATKQIDGLMKQDKVYTATVRLGTNSSTHDSEGELTSVTDTFPARERVDTVIADLAATTEQIPPMHAAIKINGTPLYKLARQGKTIERPPRPVTFHAITVDAYTPPDLQLTVYCGSGTYIRALARDIGQRLETGAYCTALRRTKIGDYDVQDAVTIDALTPENWTQYLQPIKKEAP